MNVPKKGKGGERKRKGELAPARQGALAMAAVPTTSAMWFFQDPVTRGRRGPVKTEELQVRCIV